jgi:CelD/BcsL family acetyltransferase involved in cellulose biosynthesis
VGTRRSEPDVALAFESDFAFDAPGYADLFARARATVFQHPLWLAAFARDLAPARGARLGALVARAEGQIWAVLPLLVRSRLGIRMIETADLGVGDYAAPVIDPAFARRAAGLSQRLRAEAASCLPAHDLLRIRPVREDHVEEWRWFLDVAPRPLDFSAHAVHLPGSHQDWRQTSLGPTFRKTLERKTKRFGKLAGARLRRLSDPGEIAGTIAEIARLRAGRFADDIIGQPAVRAFYADVAARGAASGLARTHVLEAEGRVIAGLFGLMDRGVHHYLLLGCDYARDGRLSPGYVAYDALIREVIAEGGQAFDFTIGDEAFKPLFGTRPTRMFQLERARGVRGVAAQTVHRLALRLRAAIQASRKDRDDDGAA